MSRIVTALSRLLEPAEREFVCGDLDELRLSAPAASANILGLVARRQLAEWTHWRPWAALFGISGLAGFSLSSSVGQAQTLIFLQVGTYLKHGVAYQAGGVTAPQQAVYTMTLLVAALLSSWACGFALASLSGRALWTTSLLFYCAVRECWAFRTALAGRVILKHSLGMTMLARLLPLDLLAILFLLALTLGIRSARKGALNRYTRPLLTAIGLTLITLLASMQNWFTAGLAQWSGRPFLPTPLLYRLLPLLTFAWPLFLSGATGLPAAGAPDFSLADSSGRIRHLADYRGKVVLLNFWATDCGGCRLEIPWFVELDQTFRRQGVAVIGISLDISYEGLKNAGEAWRKVKPFAEAHQLKYSILMGDAETEKRYGIEALPVTYVLDRRGRIAFKYVGLIDKRKVEADLKTLLSQVPNAIHAPVKYSQPQSPQPPPANQ